MSTDTFTLPRRVLEGADDQATPTVSGSSIASYRRTTRSRPVKRGAGGLLRLLLTDQAQRTAPDHLLLLGPSGGPIWTSRTR